MRYYGILAIKNRILYLHDSRMDGIKLEGICFRSLPPKSEQIGDLLMIDIIQRIHKEWRSIWISFPPFRLYFTFTT